MIHRAHDYRDLVRRWRRVAKESRTRLQPFASAAEYDLFYLRSPALEREGGIYVSAGIHGDESGATEGLITWAECNAANLARMPLLIFPCLNPWGLTHNVRTNETGVDLNRAFQRDDLPVVSSLRKLLEPHQFEVAMILHEDYDAQGVYLYEVCAGPPYWGRELLTAASRHLPADPRRRIDISTANGGLIRPRVNARRLAKLGGHPEATYLFRRYTERAITFETPSECGLERRAAAHRAILDTTVALVKKARRNARAPRPRTSP